ncbi:DUF6248 family natural product biosynthesis protein [Planomonospora algeriensis]
MNAVLFAADQAKWIRAHVWTQTMRNTHRHVPRAAASCSCQSGPSGWCLGGQHGRCQATSGLPHPETYITLKNETVVSFAVPYEHPTFSAVGAHRQAFAQVWLADRTCRYVCPCLCHTAPPGPVQLDLLDFCDTAA